MMVAQKYRVGHSVLMDEWDPEDTAKAIAFFIEDGVRCSLCGTSEWEWEENKFAYEATFTHCHGCYLKDKYAEGSENLPGTTTTLIPSSSVSYKDRQARLELERQRDADELVEVFGKRGRGRQ